MEDFVVIDLPQELKKKESESIRKSIFQRRNATNSEYSFADLFRVNRFTVNSTMGITELSQHLDIKPQSIISINDLKGDINSQILHKGDKIQLPLKANQQYLNEMEFHDLTLTDIQKHNLEEKLGDINPQSFFIYYVTTEGDIFGKVSFYDDFIGFRPISLDYCGLYDFSEHGLEHNQKMELKIDYRDMVCAPIKIPIPSETPEGLYISWYIQFELYNVGYNKFYNEFTKKKITDLKKEEKGICTFALKIPGTCLQKKVRDYQEKEDLCDKIIGLIETKMKNSSTEDKNIQHDNETTVPYFNICYGSLFEDYRNIEHIDKNFEIIHSQFGLNQKTTSCQQVNNQSLYPLNFEFPSIDKKNIKISKKANWYHNVDLQNVKKLEFVMEDTSDIIPQRLAKKIRQNLPKLYQHNLWQLQYSRLRDGMSYNTAYRQCNDRGPVVILIRDTEGVTFGGFYSESLTKATNKYVGTGESFLFKFDNNNELIKYESTFSNGFYCICDNDGIGMGADPFAGLQISNNLKQGYSHKCKTFDNEILANSKSFQIYKLEIWGFQQSEIWAW